MKNLLQKALAGWLCVVMVFGVSVPALASDGSKIRSGSVSGKVFSNEGPMPEDVIEIQMPTEREGMFNFILDPSGAIADSDAARYKSQYGSDVTFDSGKLFFQNYSVDEDGTPHISYSNRSDSLIVKNVGNVPLDVEMTLDVDKGGYEFDFANAPDFTDADGNTILGPSIYMALVTSKREAVVAPVSVEEDGVTSEKYRASVSSWLAPPEDAFRIVWDGEANAYRYKLKPDLPDSLFDSTSFYVTGALGDGVWDNAKEEMTLNISWKVIPTKSEHLENPFAVPDSSPYLQSVTYAYRKGETAKIMVDFGSGESSMTTIEGISYTMKDGTSGFVDASTMTISPYPENEYQSLVELPVSGDLFDAVSWAVRLSDGGDNTVDLDLELVLDIMKPTATVLNRASTIGGETEIRVNWGIMNAITSITYTNLSGASATISESAIRIENNEETSGGVKKGTVYVTLDEAAAKGTDFVLTMSNDEGDTAEFTLDLSNYTVEPTVEVDEKASASAPAATITVDWGFGSKAMSDVKKVTYTNPSNAPEEIGVSNITVNGNTITVRFDETSIRGRDYKLVLTNAKGASKALEVDLVEPTDPTVSVAHAASNAGETATITVNWGAGSKAMSDVSKVVYDSGEIGSENITVKGDTVEVVLDQSAADGHEHKLVLTNAFGETFTTPEVNLVANRDANVTSIQKASASGEFAAITVDWGAGAGSMSDVSKITYLNTSNARVEIDASDYTVIGNTISVRMNDDSIMGSSFQLTLKNYRGVSGSAINVDLVNEVDPTVSVTGKATNIGDSATISVNWGAGSKAMSSVSKVTYTDVSGAAKEITGSAITTDGNTVSVKFDATSIRGTNFKLILTKTGGATYEIPTALDLVNAADPTATVTGKVSASGKSATITVNWGSGSKAMSSVKEVTYKDVSGAAASIPAGSNLTTNGTTVSVKFDAISIKGTDFKLVLAKGETTFPIAVDLVEATDPTVTVSKKASATVSSATITVNWGTGSGAMASVSKVTYTNIANKSATIAASDITVNGNTVTVPFDEAAIKGTNFKLVLEKGSATKTLDVDLVTAANPTVKVNTKATASGETSTATVNWGTGASAMSSVSKITYTTVAGAAATIAKSNVTVNGDALSVKFDATSIKGSNFKVVMTKASGETYEVAVALANYEEPPSATVTKKATSPGGTSTVTVSWGVGSRAMNSVSKVTYTNASGAPAEITSTDITVSGATVSVKFDRTSILGSNFNLILSNGKGATYTLPLDLAAYDPSVGFGAEASVTGKAKTAAQTATVTVDWGSGEQAMTSVKQITYTKSGGGTDVILPGNNLKTSGNTVTVKFTPITFKGTDFILVLTNGQTDLEIPVELIDR